MNLGQQKQRIRLKSRVDIGQGWEVALTILFPTIVEPSLEKPIGKIPANNFQISGAPLGYVKQLTVYSSLRSGLGAPPFNFYDEIGPFAKRSSGEYWIHGGTRKLSLNEIQFYESEVRKFTIHVKAREQVKMDALVFWLPQDHDVKFPAVICLRLGKENVRLV